MKLNKFILGVMLLCVGVAHAGADRFGNEREEVNRASFTDTTPEINVVIASVPANGNGSLLLRRVIFSGMDASTVTFYDANIFNSNVSTRSRLEYSPNLTAGNGSGSQPSSTEFGIYFSSGLMYNKQGKAPMTIIWDWMKIGEWKGIKADPRP